MTLVKKKKLEPDLEYLKLLKFYVDLNTKVFNDFFLYSIIPPEDQPRVWAKDTNHDRYPMLLSQMGALYSLCPLRYDGMLNQKLLNFLAEHFRHNVVFILGGEGFLLYIMIMETDVEERTVINRFFANNYEELSKYQYYTSEYDPKLEKYKLLLAKTKNELDGELKDIVLTFF